MKDYKRLTKKVSATYYDIKCSSCNAIYPQKNEIPNFCETDGCYFVLKQRLGELEDKIEQGLLVELPVKVYEVRYCLGWELYEFDVTSITYSHSKGIERVEASRQHEDRVFEKSEIGNYVFLTKAEAEAKLTELRGEK